MSDNRFNGRIDLGPTPEMIASFAHFGRISPGTKFGMLNAVLPAVLAESENIPDSDLEQVAQQSKEFDKEFGKLLNQQEKWILKQLSGAAEK